EKILKSHPILGDGKLLELPRFVPVDPKKPQRLIVSCATYKDRNNVERLEFLPSFEVASAGMLKYVQDLLNLDPRDSRKALQFFFQHLDDPNPQVAADAFIEFAQAGDREIGQLAGKLPAEKLRGWLKDPRTPPSRLGLYAFLLGAGGDDADAALLRSLILKPPRESNLCIQGFLAGYIQLRPRDGWDLLCSLVRNTDRPFTERYAVLRTIRFYHAWKPEETRSQVVRVAKIAIAQGDMADVPIEDLRHWKLW